MNTMSQVAWADVTDNIRCNLNCGWTVSELAWTLRLLRGWLLGTAP